MSTSAFDSEADFARLADNLALKSDSNGDFSFVHSSSSHQSLSVTPGDSCVQATTQPSISISSTASTPTQKNAPMSFRGIKDATGPQLIGALNGYAERSHGMLSEVNLFFRIFSVSRSFRFSGRRLQKRRRFAIKQCDRLLKQQLIEWNTDNI